jgi:hypothetical protein
MLMLHTTDLSSVVSSRSLLTGSRILLACFTLQVLGSACSSTTTTPNQAPSLGAAGAAGAADQGSAADGGTRSDASTAAPGDAGTGRPSTTTKPPARGTNDAGVARADAAQRADAASDAAQSQLDVEAMSRSLAGAVCASLLECLGEQKLRAFVDSEVCEERFAAGFAQSDFSTLSDSIDRGRIELHSESLEQCYADTRALGCEIQTQRLPASCQSALRGTVAQGETCTTGADCAGQAFCPTSACPRVCSARHDAAGSCGRDEECKSGLICLQSKCAKPAAVGDACGGTTGAICALGTSCLGSTAEAAGQCATNASVQVGAVGEVCTPGGTLCREGLSCAYDGDQGFNCQEAVAAGEPCHLALPTMCPGSQYCTAEDVTTEGRCAALPIDGESCVLGSECAGGHVCLQAGSEAVVCRRVLSLGETCEVDAMCRSGRCAQGKCAATEVCD